MLNIIFCLKAVPTRLVYTNELMEEQFSLNPFDTLALKKIVAIKKKVDCKITCLCMGKYDVKDVLIHCKAAGCDDAILLSDVEFAGADTYATSLTLAKACDKIGNYDLIVCGQEAIDGETGQVPYGIANRLGLLCIGNVNEIDIINGSQIQLQYQDGEFIHTVLGELPMVVAFRDFTTKTARVNLLALKRAQAKEITVWNGNDLELTSDCIGQRGSYTEVYRSVGISHEKKDTVYLEDNCKENAIWLDTLIRKNVSHN